MESRSGKPWMQICHVSFSFFFKLQWFFFFYFFPGNQISEFSFDWIPLPVAVVSASISFKLNVTALNHWNRLFFHSSRAANQPGWEGHHKYYIGSEAFAVNSAGTIPASHWERFLGNRKLSGVCNNFWSDIEIFNIPYYTTGSRILMETLHTVA